jgi:hypothetical protein
MRDEDKTIKKGLSELTETHHTKPPERLRIENELSLKEEFYRTIIENSPS